MKVFLTGGTGFIGQKLTQALLQREWEVLALVRKPESTEVVSLHPPLLPTGDFRPRKHSVN